MLRFLILSKYVWAPTQLPEGGLLRLVEHLPELRSFSYNASHEDILLGRSIRPAALTGVDVQAVFSLAHLTQLSLSTNRLLSAGVDQLLLGLAVPAAVPCLRTLRLSFDVGNQSRGVILEWAPQAPLLLTCCASICSCCSKQHVWAI